MSSTPPLEVVVAGGGVAALETVLALRHLAADRVAPRLVAPNSEFVYRPLAVAEPFGAGEARSWPLAPLAERAGAELVPGRVEAVDGGRRTVVLDDGKELPYEALVLALGASPLPGIPGATVFRGPADSAELAALLDRVAGGTLRELVFASASGSAWVLPLYELALLTSEWLSAHTVAGATVTLVTPEDRPLAAFGEHASAAVSELLELRGIRLVESAVATAFADGRLQLAGGRAVAADAVVSLPRLAGKPPLGVPADGSGFVPVDEFGRVVGLDGVYAAGDITQFELKQGGIAAQQADAVAPAIAAAAGADVRPEPFRPVLRGLLLTGLTPRFLRSEPGSRASDVDTEPLWWPPGKIVGRHLAPFLADLSAAPSASAAP